MSNSVRLDTLMTGEEKSVVLAQEIVNLIKRR
jgi:hypothetical protein